MTQIAAKALRFGSFFREASSIRCAWPRIRAQVFIHIPVEKDML